MTTSASTAGVSTRDESVVDDDLRAYAQERATREDHFREALEDVDDLNRLIDYLVGLRKETGISQKAIAASMGVRQPTVSQFENESSDPKISTVQRYARALKQRLCFEVVPEAHCSWGQTWSRGYAEPRWKRKTTIDIWHEGSGSVGLDAAGIASLPGQWADQRALYKRLSAGSAVHHQVIEH